MKSPQLISNSMVNLRSLPLSLGTRQGCPLLPFLFNMVLEVLFIAIRQEKVIKIIHISKEKVKLLQFAGDRILHIVNSIKTPLKTIKTNKLIW